MTSPSLSTGDHRDALLRHGETGALVLVRLMNLRHQRWCRGSAASALEVPVQSRRNWRHSLKLHGIADVIGATLQGRRDYNPHSRARHPAA
jgi:hypothetical protein